MAQQKTFYVLMNRMQVVVVKHDRERFPHLDVGDRFLYHESCWTVACIGDEATCNAWRDKEIGERMFRQNKSMRSA